jgi:uncharacterized protein (DUF1800 family)
VGEGPGATIDALARPPDDRARAQVLDSVRPLLDFSDVSILQAWWILRMRSGLSPLAEKLALFWHGHFATSNGKVGELRAMHAQNLLFLERGAGDFRAIVHAVAKDPAMLAWLDGNENVKGRPNENFARELMELFTLGIGTYGERDVLEAARAFTGWTARGSRFAFRARTHDDGEKTVLGRTAPFGGEEVVDLCVDHPATPRRIAGKLFAFFAYPDPPSSLLDRLAALFVEEDLEVGALVETILRSRAFFSRRARRALVKSPAEFCVGALRALGTRANGKAVGGAMREMGQSLFEPPSVKGWDGGRAWLGSAALLARARFAARVASPSDEGLGTAFDSLSFFPASARSDAERAVEHAIGAFVPDGVPPAVRATLVESVREGPGDLAEKLRGLVAAALMLPEYQLA